MIPNYSMIPAAAIQWSPGIRWSPAIWWSPAIRWSIRSMDFDYWKVYGDTSITDGLVWTSNGNKLCSKRENLLVDLLCVLLHTWTPGLLTIAKIRQIFRNMTIPEDNEEPHHSLVDYVPHFHLFFEWAISIISMLSYCKCADVMALILSSYFAFLFYIKEREETKISSMKSRIAEILCRAQPKLSIRPLFLH